MTISTFERQWQKSQNSRNTVLLFILLRHTSNSIGHNVCLSFVSGRSLLTCYLRKERIFHFFPQRFVQLHENENENDEGSVILPQPCPDLRYPALCLSLSAVTSPHLTSFCSVLFCSDSRDCHLFDKLVNEWEVISSRKTMMSLYGFSPDMWDWL